MHIFFRPQPIVYIIYIYDVIPCYVCILPSEQAFLSRNSSPLLLWRHIILI